MSKKIVAKRYTKSEAIEAAELYELLNEYAARAEELRKRGYIATFQIANGQDGNEIKIVNFQMIKIIKLPGAAQDNGPKEGQSAA